MACIIKAPSASTKGVVIFTTQERDLAINKDEAARAAVNALKDRFVIGLHHNWHDHSFVYDPLFDFSMAGEDDLREVNGRGFPHIPLDACNFAPSCFHSAESEKFWDVLHVSRAVSFKNLPGFFAAVRRLYDRGHNYRILHLCATPPQATSAFEQTAAQLRREFEALFSPEERKRFTLLTMDFDYPFPLDLETLAFLYRSSHTFVHFAPDERRARVAAYAWASGIPVVAQAAIGSLLPPGLRRRPFFYESNGRDFEKQMHEAVQAAKREPRDFSPVRDIVSEDAACERLQSHLRQLFTALDILYEPAVLNLNGLDIRLGRHHGIATGGNRVDQTIETFAQRLIGGTDAEIQMKMGERDPERALASSSDPNRPANMHSIMKLGRRMIGTLRRSPAVE